VSYTLRGRLELRFAAGLVALLVAAAATAAIHDWWPVELAGTMVAVGVTCDVVLYDRLIPYQPGWAAVPLGLFELAAVVVAAEQLEIMAPIRPALALFAVGWLAAQVLGHAVLPLRRLSYAEDGGELGVAGRLVTTGFAAVAAGAVAAAWVTQPPTVYLAAGIHRGPIVIDRTETLVGRPGAVVQGGLVVKADDVTVRDLTVVGGEDGVTVEGATNVQLDDVRVRGATLDGFHVRRAQVMISDCSVAGLRSRYGQGIDISFTFDMPMSMVEGCTVRGGQEGIVADSSRVELRENSVTGSTMRGITVTEMSMGTVEENDVEGTLGIGIFCADQSECMIARNVVARTRPDLGSADLSRRGYGIVAHSAATAFLEDNAVARNPYALGVFAGGVIRHGSAGFDMSSM
jgi:parallel beta-helix repeat protein